jgi:hypothetical protein
MGYGILSECCLRGLEETSKERAKLREIILNHVTE